MQSAESLTEITIWAVKWYPLGIAGPQMKFFRSAGQAESFMRELQQWADKLGVLLEVNPEIEYIQAEVE